MDMICRFKDAHDVEVLPMTIHEALRQYLAEHRHVAPAREGRAGARDLHETVFSQDALLQQRAQEGERR